MIERLGLTARYADATIFNGIVHTVEVPASESGTIETQAPSLLQALERSLVAAGSAKNHLLMATVYLTDMSHYDAFNVIWEAWLPAGCAPARACVKVAGLARPGWKVEVAAVAARRT